MHFRVVGHRTLESLNPASCLSFRRIWVLKALLGAVWVWGPAPRACERCGGWKPGFLLGTRACSFFGSERDPPHLLTSFSPQPSSASPAGVMSYQYPAAHWPLQTARHHPPNSTFPTFQPSTPPRHPHPHPYYHPQDHLKALHSQSQPCSLQW